MLVRLWPLAPIVAALLLGKLLWDTRVTLGIERHRHARQIEEARTRINQSEANRTAEREAAEAALAELQARNDRLTAARDAGQSNLASLRARLNRLRQQNDELEAALATRDAEFHRLRCDTYAAAGYPTGGACGGAAVPGEPTDIQPRGGDGGGSL